MGYLALGIPTMRAYYININVAMNHFEGNLQQNTQNKKENTSASVLGGHASLTLMLPYGV